MLSSFISAEDPTKVWVGHIKRDGRARYLVHQKQMDSLSYQVSQDCDTVVDYLETVERSFNWLFKTEQSHGSHPALLKLYIKKSISLETLLIYDQVLGYITEWDKVLKDPLWEGLSLKIKKYKPFLSIPVSKYKEMLQEKFASEVYRRTNDTEGEQGVGRTTTEGSRTKQTVSVNT